LLVIAGHRRSKNVVTSFAYVPAIRIFVLKFVARIERSEIRATDHGHPIKGLT